MPWENKTVEDKRKEFVDAAGQIRNHTKDRVQMGRAVVRRGRAFRQKPKAVVSPEQDSY